MTGARAPAGNVRWAGAGSLNQTRLELREAFLQPRFVRGQHDFMTARENASGGARWFLLLTGEEPRALKRTCD
jgi:hypothetical protein